MQHNNKQLKYRVLQRQREFERLGVCWITINLFTQITAQSQILLTNQIRMLLSQENKYEA